MQQQQPGWYAPPGAGPGAPQQGPGYAHDVMLEPGGFGIRAVAHIVDVVAMMVAAFFAGAIGGVIVAVLAGAGVVPGGWQVRLRGSPAITYAFGFIASIAYHTLSEGLGGASAGKAICGLRVLTERREPCSVGKALGRNLAYYIDALFFGLVAWTSMSKSPMMQRYGDKWAGTIVIKTASAHGLPMRSPALGIVVGFFAYGFVQVIAIVLKAI